MKKVLAAALIAGFTATSSMAGGLSTIVEEPTLPVLEDLEENGSSSSIWLPLAVVIALIAVAAS